MRLIDADELYEEMLIEMVMTGFQSRALSVIVTAPTIDPAKAESFVDELIGYIFTYPDDDYMTIETLCRKLHKHGLIDKKDGKWICDTPQTEEELEEPNYYDTALWE